MTADEIQAQMIEHEHYNVTRAETQYRWDFGIHHVADKYNDTMGDKDKWLAFARARAAAVIVRLMERA